MHGVKLKNANSAVVGGANENETFLSQSLIGQPSTSASASTLTLTSKVMGDNFLDDEPSFGSLDFDLKAIGMGMEIEAGLGANFVDSLGDTSMDIFTDLSGMLMEPTFIMEPSSATEDHDNSSATLNFLNLQPAANLTPQQRSSTAKRSFAETAEDTSTDLARLSANVGLTRSRTPSLDHDYSAKRARLSPSIQPPQEEDQEEEEPSRVAVPEVSPVPSPSPETDFATAAERRKQRRDKNNLASKRSREIRKLKFRNMESEAERLSAENARLEKRVVEMEKLAQEMKQVLVQKMKIQT